jgi:DNA-binding NarL/FixJ family response regulator
MKIDCGPILVVDGDDEFRALATGLLERGGFATLAFTNGDAASAAAREARPGLVLMDVELPGVTGYQMCREFRDLYGEELPIILTSSTRVDVIDRVAALLIGADEYIAKPVAPQEPLARVRRLLERAAALSRRRPVQRTDPGALGLSPREIDVLRLLASGMTNAAIAQALFISSKTVATHIHGIFAKFGVRTRSEAVAFAFREGLVEAEPRIATSTTI